MVSPCYCWVRQDPLLRAPTLMSEALDRKTVDRMQQVSDDGYGKGEELDSVIPYLPRISAQKRLVPSRG